MHKRKRITLFEGLNLLFFVFFSLLVLLPFWNLAVLSFSSPESSFASNINLWPQIPTLSNYEQVFSNKYIYLGYQNTLFRTIVGTILSTTVTVMAAYSLSKRYFPHRNFWTMLIVFTMFFNAGLVPTYLWNKDLGLLDNKLVLILPGLVSAYNLVIARNFFLGIPEAVEESARIDGANDLQVFIKIVTPMSKPILATLALWIAVGHWNSWFDSMLYLREAEDQVLQVVLRRIVLEGEIAALEMNDPNNLITANPESIKAATIMAATLPILCIYPFAQKYFVKGVNVGAMKG